MKYVLNIKINHDFQYATYGRLKLKDKQSF